MTTTTVLTPPAPAAMTPPPIGKLAPAGPQPHRWSVAEYRELGKTGLFQDKKVMLLHGEIYVMPPPDPPHDIALGLTDDWLRTVFPAGHSVRIQMGFDVGTRNDPSPDIAVVVGSRRDHTTTPTAAVLIVEVADSSLMTDLTVKAELYATAGVPEYWVLDLDGRELTVFRDPQPLPAGLGAIAYRTRLTIDAAGPVAPLAAPASTIPVAALLP